MHSIASLALATLRHRYWQMVTEQHLAFTEYSCYRSVTERLDEKCFDLQVRSLFFSLA